MINRIRNGSYLAVCLTFFVFAVANWAQSIRELRRFYIGMWIWDPWNYLASVDRYKHLDWTTLWIQHNEHREIGTEISYIIDIFLFHGKELVPELVGIAAYVAAFLLFISFAFFRTEASTPVDKWATTAAALLVTAIAGYKTCVISLATPFLTSWPQWEFFGAAALAAIVLHKRRGGKLLLVAAIAFATCTTYSMSNGMLTWPVLILAALLLRIGWRQITAIALSGAIVISLYFFHYQDMHSLSFDSAVHHPAYFFMFLGSFLGMPFSTAYSISRPMIMASVAGWAGLAIGLADLICILRNRLFAAPAVITLGGFCLLVLVSAILTALGRMDPADEFMQASQAGRYLTEPTLFWCALLLLTVVLMGNVWKGYASLLFVCGAGILSARQLHNVTPYYNRWENYFQHGQWAAIALANGVSDNTVSDTLYPSREFFAQYKHILFDNHLAMFADPEPGWIGRSANHVFTRGADAEVHGEVTTVKRLGGDYEIQGWADGVTRVVFIDKSNRIIGFGIRPKTGPVELYTHDVPAKLAFTGFIRGEFGAQEFSLWAVDRKGERISRMGRLDNFLNPVAAAPAR